jgi:hypothetical protein
MRCCAAPMARNRCAADCMECCCQSCCAGGGPAAPEPMIAVRSNFDPLAVFEPTAVTDGNGNAIVKFTLPDNLTRYRVWAVAVAQAQCFGLGESSIVAQHPLMVRPSLPRFLNFGDFAELPVVLQNNSTVDIDARVAMRASNAQVCGNGKAEVSNASGTELTCHWRCGGGGGTGDAARLHGKDRCRKAYRGSIPSYHATCWSCSIPSMSVSYGRVLSITNA